MGTRGAGTTVNRPISYPAAQESPRPLKRRLATKRTNGGDKSALIDLCEANRGAWCSSWSADGYGSDPCRDDWTGVNCDSSQFRVTGLVLDGKGLTVLPSSFTDHDWSLTYLSLRDNSLVLPDG